MGIFRRTKKEKVKINPSLACAAVVLANRGARYEFLHKRLNDLRERYDLGLRFRTSLDGEVSEEFGHFLGRLEAANYADSNGQVFSLRTSGIRLLEEKVVKAYREMPIEQLRTFAKDAGILLDDILKRYLERVSPESS